MPDFEHKRSHRVAQLIQEELGRLLVEGLKDPRVGFVTVTEVRVSDDLRTACAYVSIFGTTEVRQTSLTGLRAAAGFLKRELGHRLQLRYTPHLTFAHDATLDHAQRVDDLLNAVARGEHEAPDPAALQPLPPVDISRVPLPSETPPEIKRPPRRPRSRSQSRLRRTDRSSKRK